ncbi:hypothetical protein AS850_05270 [Frondihabitans sp. 762G35]|uniref:hypothetical protein n=1 Tax=Frondihabitans sp. 762G35 TaxID=1446794 RepID=UPI000D2027A3|nr:hypothetical protein [Frondihabitans sp. 762G35]ARC56483.1 hypothetical protein AS850_05270 [Frondihabitans sp. 762G35]
MSSTNGQPPLTRRQVRELERAREAGEAITGSISVVSGSPVPSAMPVTTPSPVSAPKPASVPAPASVPVAGHAPTRRELRAQREAEAPAGQSPVPLKAPAPEHERDLSEALSHVADIENGQASTPRPPQEAPRVAGPGAAASGAAGPGAAIAGAAVPGAASPAEPASPPQSELPAPVSVSRVDAPSATAPADLSVVPEADSGRPGAGPVFEDVPGPRRTGSTGPVPETASPRSGPPAPSSTPTVFPFVLSGGQSPQSAPATTGSSRIGAAEVAPSAAASAPAASAAAASAPAPAAASSSGTSAPAGGRAAAAAAPVEPPRAAQEPRATASRPEESPSPRRQQPPQIPASVPEPSGYVPPTGHWSTQGDVDDDTIDTVGSHFGTVTGQQNALILDDDKLPDVTGALNATGEIIITGSIDLPRSLAATGSHHAQRIDGADIDRMLEESDRDAPDSDATPVRASRAVSANTSTRAVVLTAGKPKTNRAPIIAAVCASVVGVGIVVTVIVAFANGII